MKVNRGADCMKIGELAKLTGLAPSRIRFYEAEGLIADVKRQANGYREYSREAVLNLELIASAQRAGFSLDQIRHLLPARDGGWDHAGLLRVLTRRVDEITAMQKRLKQVKAQLVIAIQSIEDRPADISCEDNRQRVMGRLRRKGVVASQARRAPRKVPRTA